MSTGVRGQLDAPSMRITRLLESRKLAKEAETQKQQRYRDAMVASVEDELFRRMVGAVRPRGCAAKPFVVRWLER